MSGSHKCHHPELVARIEMSQERGAREAYAHIIGVHCDTCGQRFRFVGVDPMHDAMVPGVNQTATEIVLPMVEIG